MDTVGIHDTVIVQLTTSGTRIVEEERQKIIEQIGDFLNPEDIDYLLPPAVEGQIALPLWQVMRLFAPYLQVGKDIPFSSLSKPE